MADEQGIEWAVKTGDLEGVKSAVADGADVNKKDNGWV
jgi:hypothetical protein